MLSVPAQSQSVNQQQYVLEKLTKCNHLNQLKQLQAFLVTLGHSQSQFYAFKLVRFSALTLANLSYARFIFDSVYSPNVFLFAAMISAYASQPDHRSAFTLYRNMLRRGCPQPNEFIYPHVLKSSFEVLEFRGTNLVHTQIEKTGFGQHPVVQTALVHFYSRFRHDIGTARLMFDKMTGKSVVSWTVMISGYTRLGDIESALSLFENMPERDIPSWNSVIAGCIQNGQFSEAISLFKRMIFLVQEGQSRDIRPNKITVACALSACGHTGMLQLGKWIHGYVYRNGLGPDSFILDSLVDMYGKCGNLKEARRVFDMISHKGLTSWNSLINCYALHGQSRNAIGVFEEMIQRKNNVKPDEITFVGLLNACTHGGLVEKGIALFDMMTDDFGINPQIEHYGCLVDLLGRAGLLDRAMSIVKGMRIEPDDVIWGSLLNGCKIYGRTDLAEFAIKKLIEICPNNGGYDSMLANIYGGLGKWDEVRKARKILKDRNAYKAPGCSWIEVNEQVYQFYSTDRKHPRTEEIYKILESLVGVVGLNSG